MKIVSKQDFLMRKDFFIGEMGKGKVFVYPTDTIYGVGCEAHNSLSITKIRMMKKRDGKPFSVIAPNINWIEENCIINDNVGIWLKKLPGPFTLILELKKASGISENINLGKESLGVRIPNHWFYSIVEDFGRPFVTTSVNISGEKPLAKLEELKEEFKNTIDYYIDDGFLDGKPSKIVNLIGSKVEVIERK